MSREDAEAVLQHRNNGTFLIRQSINPSRRGELTLSVKSVVKLCLTGHSEPRVPPNCRVLPPGEFNDVIPSHACRF